MSAMIGNRRNRQLLTTMSVAALREKLSSVQTGKEARKIRNELAKRERDASKRMIVPDETDLMVRPHLQIFTIAEDSF